MSVRNMVKIAVVFLLLTIERNVTGQKEPMKYFGVVTCQGQRIN